MSVLLLAESEAYNIGGAIGRGLFLLLVVLGIVKCLAISRRERTSATCVSGLTLLLFGMLTGSLSGSGKLGSGSGATAIQMLGGLAAISSVVVAIVGLVTYRKERFDQGRKQAIAVLVVVGGIIGITAYARAGRISRTPEDRPTEAIRFEELNFRFQPPPAGWLKFDAKGLRSDACLAFRRPRPMTVFMVIAERIGVEHGMSSKQLAALGQETLRSAVRGVSIGRATEIRHAGMTGFHFRSTATILGAPVDYDHRVFAHNGYCFQLVTTARGAAAPTIEDDADALLRCFDLIDRDRIVHADDVTIVARHDAPRLGYAVDLAAESWFTSPELIGNYVDEDLVVCHESRCWLSVIAIPVAADLALSDEALLGGLLGLRGLEYPGTELRHRTAREVDGRNEIRFDYASREEDGSRYHCLARVTRANGFAYFICAERPENDAGMAKLQQSALDRVRFLTPDQPLEPGSMNRRQQATQAQFSNYVGVHYYEEGAYEQAGLWFLQACAFPEPDPVFLRNYRHVAMQLDRPEEALALFDRYADVVRAHPDLRGDRAWCLDRIGRTADARREYAALFAAGSRDFEAVDGYVGLLLREDAAAEALRLLEAQRAQHDSAPLVGLHARVLMHSDRFEEARTLLASQESPRPAPVQRLLVEAHEALEEYAEGLAVVEALLADGYDSVEEYRAKARLQIALKRWLDAGDTLGAGIRRYPDDPALAELQELVIANAGR